MKQKTYTIGQVAAKLNVNIETLYYYDRQGLLPFVKRDQNGNRQFTLDDIEMLLTIFHLKNAGVKLKDIKKFIDWRLDGDTTLTKRLKFIQNQERILQQKITDLKRSMQILKYKDWYYQTAVEAGTEKIHLLPGTYQYNEEAAAKFVEYVNQMSETEKELFEIEQHPTELDTDKKKK